MPHMNDQPGGQLEMRFGEDPEERGYNQWQKQRRRTLEKLTRQMGLPLNHAAEVWLKGGVRLRGVLKLKEEQLFVDEKRDMKLELTVDGVSFTAAEIESWVRMD
jgi:hypothetical protein